MTSIYTGSFGQHNINKKRLKMYNKTMLFGSIQAGSEPNVMSLEIYKLAVNQMLCHWKYTSWQWTKCYVIGNIQYFQWHNIWFTASLLISLLYRNNCLLFGLRHGFNVWLSLLLVRPTKAILRILDKRTTLADIGGLVGHHCLCVFSIKIIIDKSVHRKLKIEQQERVWIQMFFSLGLGMDLTCGCHYYWSGPQKLYSEFYIR
jgi:hypothetical protein